MEEMNPNSCMAGKKITRPQEQLNCPRCKSTNTKFCYYNNYSLTQPRYFCKSCRRYWTEGGSLRNVPIGGGSRKNRIKSSYPSLSSSSSSSLSSADHHHFQTYNNSKLPKYPSGFSSQTAAPASIYEAGKDLNLAFPHYVEVPKVENLTCDQRGSDQITAMELLRSSGIGSRGVNSFIPNLMPDSDADLGIVNPYPSGFSLPDEFKPNLSVDGRSLISFEELNQQPAAGEADQNERQGHSSGYWSGMMGDGRPL